MAANLPRRFLLTRASRARGGCQGCRGSPCRGPSQRTAGLVSKGRDGSLVESGAETPVVVQGAKALIDACPEGEPKSPFGRGGKGHESPLLDGSRESEFALAVMQRRNVALSPNGLDGLSGLINRLAKNVPKTFAPSDSQGGSAGDGKSPRKVGAVLPAHTLYNSTLANPHYFYGKSKL